MQKTNVKIKDNISICWDSSKLQNYLEQNTFCLCKIQHQVELHRSENSRMHLSFQIYMDLFNVITKRPIYILSLLKILSNMGIIYRTEYYATILHYPFKFKRETEIFVQKYRTSSANNEKQAVQTCMLFAKSCFA